MGEVGQAVDDGNLFSGTVQGRMRTVVFWQDLESMHQSAVIRALATLPGYRVLSVAQRSRDSRREAMGWQHMDTGKAECHRAPDEQATAEIIRDTSSSGAFHLFAGIQAVPAVYQALLAVARGPARIGIVAEGVDGRGVSGAARAVLYRYYRMRHERRIEFILAMGSNGMSWYRRAGFSSEYVLPYAYFVEEPVIDPVSTGSDGRAFTIVFVGRLVRRKGVDLLLRSLALITGQAWRLRVIGDGVEKASLQRLAGDLNIADRIEWVGFQTNSDTTLQLRRADLLVLPSRHDGWGAVVNEAMVAGIPAICTNTCGAADLLFDERRGEVVPSGDVEALASAIRRRVDAGIPTESDREAIRHWSRRISGEAGAAYLDAVFTHLEAMNVSSAPLPPWLDSAPNMVQSLQGGS